jgi:hypothetical protein
MRSFLDTAGERLEIECSLSWVAELIAEGSAGELRRVEASDASVRVRVESDRHVFQTDGWQLLTRGAWRRGGEIVVENVCTAGFDLHLRCTPEVAEFTYRWRPPPRDRIAARVLRSRFHLLARAVLMQYPALWAAGIRGRAPLHASACIAGGSTPLVTAPSGIGRSTVIFAELELGGRATGDNLAVGDGTTVWGLVEPLRVEGAGGRGMPHGRQEAPMKGRAEELVPDSLVVLERLPAAEPSILACSPVTAGRALVTSTYMAGELRRYWAFAATLSAGTGLGPAHPPVLDVASAFAAKLRCFSVVLGRRPGARLPQLVDAPEVEACA